MVFASSFRRKSLASSGSTCSHQGRACSSAASCQHSTAGGSRRQQSLDEEQDNDTKEYRPPSSFFARRSISDAFSCRRPSVPEAWPSPAPSSPGKRQYNAATVTGASMSSPFSTVTPSTSNSNRRPSLFHSWRSARRRSSVQQSQQQQQAMQSPSSSPAMRTLQDSSRRTSQTYLSSNAGMDSAIPTSPTHSSSSLSTLWDALPTNSKRSAGGIADTWIYSTYQWTADGAKGSLQPGSPRVVGLNVDLQRQSSSPRPPTEQDDSKSVVSMSLTEEIALYMPENQVTPQAHDVPQAIAWNMSVWNTPATQYTDAIEDEHTTRANLGMMQANESGFIDPHYCPSPHHGDVQWDVPQWSDFASDSHLTPRPQSSLQLRATHQHRALDQVDPHFEDLTPRREYDYNWRDGEQDEMLTPRLVGGKLPNELNLLARTRSSDSRRSDSSSPSLYSPTSALPPTPGAQLHFTPALDNDEERRGSADSLNKQFCSILLLDLGNGNTVSMSPSPSSHPLDSSLHHYDIPSF